MGSTVDSVLSTLGIDRVNMNGKLTLIEEQHGTSANFIISSILTQAVKRKDGICLVLFHNTFDHYHNIGTRFGCNLVTLKEKGTISVVEPMRALISDLHQNSSDSISLMSVKTSDNGTSYTDIIYKLFAQVKHEYDEVAKHHDSVTIIIDDLSHLSDLGFSVKESMHFVRYLRSLMDLHPKSQLCILMHSYQNDPQTCDPDMICNGLRHMAHLCVTVEPLKTGHSSDASGKMTVCWRTDCVRREYHWAEKTTYLYKLIKSQIKIYAPGTAVAVA